LFPYSPPNIHYPIVYTPSPHSAHASRRIRLTAVLRAVEAVGAALAALLAHEAAAQRRDAGLETAAPSTALALLGRRLLVLLLLLGVVLALRWRAAVLHRGLLSVAGKKSCQHDVRAREWLPVGRLDLGGWLTRLAAAAEAGSLGCSILGWPL